ncbi:MAG: hypothetical protein LBD80_02685 [Tannerella sp.]|jgi:WD40 repeat protein|nr:hypothetical protein [Tannerella sp.]
MKDLKPKFILARVYDDSSQDKPEIAPLSKVIAEAKMNRRGFFGTGLTAAAAILLLDGCKTVKLEYPNIPDKSGGENCKAIHAHKNNVTALAVSPDGKRLFSGSSDKTVRNLKIWSLPSGKLLKTLSLDSDSDLPKDKLIKIKTLSHSGHPIALSPDRNRLFFSVSFNEKKIFFGQKILLKRIYIYMQNLQDGTSTETKKIYAKHLDDIRSLMVSPDGKQLFSMSNNYINAVSIYDSIKIWDLPEGKLRKTLTMKSKQKWSPEKKPLAVSPDGKYLFAGDDNGFITLIKLPDGNVTRKIKASDDAFYKLALSPDGKWLASLSKGIIQLWNLPHFVLKKQKYMPEKSGIFTFSADSQWLVLGTYNDIQLINLSDLTVEKCLIDLACTENTVEGVTYSVTDERGRTITYTLPCGSPTPAGAICTCDCVPGSRCTCHSHKVCTCHSHCTCNKVCTCNPQYRCTCYSVCTCQAV